jgi:hypothetical protein
MQTREETISYLKTMRDGHMEQVNRLDKTIEQLNGIIDVLEKQAIAQGVSIPAPSVPAVDFPIGKLRKLTQLQAIVAIAVHNGGTVKAQDAKRLLIEAHVMRETKNSTNITHNVIIRSGKFDRIGPGEYRLKSAAKNEDGKEFYASSPIQ